MSRSAIRPPRPTGPAPVMSTRAFARSPSSGRTRRSACAAVPMVSSSSGARSSGMSSWHRQQARGGHGQRLRIAAVAVPADQRGLALAGVRLAGEAALAGAAMHRHVHGAAPAMQRVAAAVDKAEDLVARCLCRALVPQLAVAAAQRGAPHAQQHLAGCRRRPRPLDHLDALVPGEVDGLHQGRLRQCTGSSTTLAEATRPWCRSSKACAPCASGRRSTHDRSPKTPRASAATVARRSAML